jgi:DNA-binding beta-propeller fold protein YncE
VIAGTGGRLVPALLALALVLASSGCAREEYGGFDHPRTVRLAPDGRLLVTDLGTGRDDGRVVAIDPDGGRRTLLDRLPSTRGSGQAYADLAGPSGADVAPDGTVCAVIGDATVEGRGFGTLRCGGGLVVDLEGFERRVNPDRRGPESNPYDVVSDRRGGWYVSDAAANDVLHVDGAGRVRVAADVASLARFGGRPVQAVPTGLSLAPDGRVLVALLGGAPFGDGAGAVIALTPASGQGQDRAELVARAPYPIGAIASADGVAVLSLGADFRAKASGRILRYGTAAGAQARTLADGLARPTGFALLGDGRFVVAEEGTGRLRTV